MPETVICPECRKPFVASARRKKFCSRACCVAANTFSDTIAPCSVCNVDFRVRHVSLQREPVQLFCSVPCARSIGNAKKRVYASKADRKRVQKQRRRARLRSVETELFSDVEIFARDRWICGLCHKPVDRRLRHPDKMAASLDHIVSLRDGGSHTRANVQCAHFLCNSRKTFRSAGQMHLPL